MEPGWKSILAAEFEKPYFSSLVSFVKTQYQTTTVYPPGSRIFHAFDACPWENLKVVILGQDPYINPGQAHGLSFSVPDGCPFPPSLLNIFKELEDDVHKPLPSSGNLEHWASQGVLLLNTVLTVQAGLSNSHQGKGWETFTDAVIQAISDKKEGIVFLLWGTPARKKAAQVDRQKHHILESPHPSPLSAYRGFFGNRHFSKTNEYLKSKGNSPINW